MQNSKAKESKKILQANKLKKSESKEALIERLLTKAELDFKCCSSKCGHIYAEISER